MTVKDSNVKDNNVKVSSVKDNNVKVSSVKDNSVKDGVSPDNSTGNSGSEEDVAVDTDKNQSENLSTLFTDVQKAYLKKFSINIPNDKNSQAVLALYLDMVAAYNKKDINPIASIYSEDYVYSESNKKSALETIKEEFNIGPGIEMKIDSIKIKCDKNSALVDFVYYFEGKAEDGFAIEREYSLTPRKDFLQKTEGSWFLKKSE
jgi:ketosteroid isomerase-like protein